MPSTRRVAGVAELGSFDVMRVITLIIGLMMTVGVAGCTTRSGTTVRDSYESPPQPQAQQSVGVASASTNFGTYDRAFLGIVSNHWHELLEAINYKGYRAGEVVIIFKLHPDGRITDSLIKKNTVSAELGKLCQKALLDQQPYEPWSREMRHKIAEDFRQITFTFYHK